MPSCGELGRPVGGDLALLLHRRQPGFDVVEGGMSHPVRKAVRADAAPTPQPDREKDREV